MNFNEYTELSQKEYDNILKSRISAEEAYRYLESGLKFRTFSETLMTYYKGENLKSLLVEKLLAYNPGMARDSLAKKVSGWLNGSYSPTDRETLLQLCFALGLDEVSANDFLSCSSDSGFHYRSPRELAYIFALRTGLDYDEALNLYESIPKIQSGVGEYCKDDMIFTETIFNEFYKVKTKEQFDAFINNNLYMLGNMHNTAYYYLKTFVKCLQNPDEDYSDVFGEGDNWDNSQRLSIESITERYLRMNVPSGADKGKSSPVEKIVKQYWPSATSMKRMCSGTEDVKRKVLILLYIITEGVAEGVNYEYVYDDLTPEERFTEHFDRICTMLLDCGMSMPDPRNAFDWVALYAIKMNHQEAMSEELEILLEKIFGTERNLTDVEFADV